MRREIDDLLSAFGGSVDNEETTNDRRRRIERSTAGAAGARRQVHHRQARLGELGKLKTSSESGKDVTTQVIDVDERVQTLQTSLDRCRSTSATPGT